MTLAGVQPSQAHLLLRLGNWSVIGAAVLVLMVHLWMALTKSINWDEFHHFDLIRQYAAGTLTAPLQTFYVHLFGWTLWVPGDATVQIRAARLAMLVCTAGTALALFNVAQRFASRQAAALTALTWLTGGYVVLHATSLRTDTLAAFLLMSALWLFACKPLALRNALAVGILAGLATAITIKSPFYLTAFLAIFLLRWQDDGRAAALKRFAQAGLAAVATFAALYFWHRSLLPWSPTNSGGESLASAQRVVFSEGLLPRWNFIKTQMIIAPHIVVLIALAPLAWLLARSDWRRNLVLILLLSPLLTLLFYRNAFPYFFVFLLPPVMVAVAPAWEPFVRRYSAALPALAMAALAFAIGVTQSQTTLAGQRQTIAAVDRMFPEPVAYIDFAGSLGAHRRAVPFLMSGWGLMEYRRKGEPQLRQLMEREPVPLLIANHWVISAALEDKKHYEHLIDADAKALRDNYIPHWGHLYVAGKNISAGPEPIDSTFLVPGPYTVEDGPLEIDGTVYSAGDFIALGRGVHRIGGGRTAPATLRWGRNLPKPVVEPLPAPPFDEF